MDAGFVLALPFHHRDLEPDCVEVSTKGGGTTVSCTGCGEWYHEEHMLIPCKTSLENMSGLVTTAEYIRVYIIAYIFFLIRVCVHLDMLNINK